MNDVDYWRNRYDGVCQRSEEIAAKNYQLSENNKLAVDALTEAMGGIEELLKENIRLSIENERWKHSHAEVCQEFDDLNTDYDSLSRQYDELALHLAIEEDEVEDLTEELEAMHNENQELGMQLANLEELLDERG